MTSQMTPLEAAAELLLSDDYLVIPVPMANWLGLLETVLLKKIDSWCSSNRKCQKKNYFKNGFWWTNGSYQEWNDRLPCIGSARTIQRLALALEKQGLLISDQLSSKKSDRTKWYRVDRNKLGQLYLDQAKSLIESIVPDWHGDSEQNQEEDEWVEIHSANLALPQRQNGTITTTDCGDALIYNDSLKDSLNDLPLTGEKKGKKEFGFQIQERTAEVSNISLATSSKPTEIVTATKAHDEIIFSAAAPARQNWKQQRQHDVHPNHLFRGEDTPWLNPDGQFKPEFVSWLAKRWSAKYNNTDFFQAEENVICNFFNEPQKIPVRWSTYAKTLEHHYQNAAHRVASGGAITEDELRYLDTNKEAVIQKAQLLPPALPSSTTTYQMPPELQQLTPEQMEANAKRLREMTAKAFNRSLPPARKQTLPLNSTVEEIQQLLLDKALSQDPSFQRQLKNWVKGRTDIVADTNEHGQIYMIERF